MQDNKNLQSFDHDILQCKADILKALGTPNPNASTPPALQSPQTQPDLDDSVIDPDFLDAELNAPEKISEADNLAAPAPAASAETIHIPSFESLSKRLLPVVDAEAVEEMDLRIEPQTGEVSLENPNAFTIPDDDPLDLSNIDSEETHAENGILKTMLEQAQKRHADERIEKEKALDQLRAISETIEPLRTANDRLQQQLTELALQNQDAIRESNVIHQGLVRSLEEEKAAHTSDRGRLERLQGELQKVAKARDFLSESFSAVSEQNRQLQAELERLTQTQTDLANQSQQQTAELVLQKDQLEQKLTEIQIASTHLNAALANAKSQNDELLLQRDQWRQQLQESRLATEKAEHALAGWQRQKQQNEEETARLHEQLAQFQSLQRELQVTVSHNHALRQEMSEIEAALSQHQVKIRDLEAQVRQLTDEKDSVRQQLDQVNRSDEQLRSDENAQRRELETLQQTYLKYRRQAEQEIEELNHKFQSLIGHVRIVEHQAAEHKHEAEIVKLRLQETVAADETVRRELELAHDNEQSLRANLTELENKITALQVIHCNAIETVQAEKKDIEEQQRQFTHERHQLQKEIERLQLEMRLRDEAESASSEPNLRQPQDTRLETILEPEEISALMTPLEHEDQMPAEALSAEAEHSDAPVSDRPAVQTDEPDKSAFSLADLIISEHRRAVSSRRQRVSPASGQPGERGIRQVLEQYVKPAASAMPQTVAPAGMRYAAMWEDDFLTPFQRDLLKEIIQKDIEALSQNNRLSRQA